MQGNGENVTGSDEPVTVTSVEVVRDFVLRFTFSDSTTREVDFEDNVRGHALEPTDDPTTAFEKKSS
jgi:hypothetical protein